ncbi:type II toxin-antitoxin system PemK/MazF family toxin [Paractinoplanes atraurantiacus]|uniref:PemK-like, MazF-like toxin of type II toxin-antitoxin system n=1 Tax=Paractinoplanes atraurantiacus TaxID=1036182 RepID=A0A285KS82_9ACTN|nr:type II toxin-antitoxin system PemK/MazF family toxin [Actinoplanes atraurantiacus]SNY75475.1 PemK-like, MazF-like toxin of type II toxin-antitoxin system [Actinoplanes atraurantiacus]
MAKILKDLFRRLTGRTAPAPEQRPAPRPHPTAPHPRPAPTARPAQPARPGTPARHVPTHERGRHIEYAPQPDGDADPGEVVWTWVPYEDDPAQGKDRPVLVVGRSGRTVLGLMLSSQSDRDGQRNWMGLGAGTWDKEKRPSWIRLDRVIEVDHDGIRREGAVLDRTRFDRVAAKLRQDYGWR